MYYFRYVCQGRYADAEPLYKECLSKFRELVGNSDERTLTSISNLAHLYSSEGNYEEAESLYNEFIILTTAKHGDHHHDTLR